MFSVEIDAAKDGPLAWPANSLQSVEISVATVYDRRTGQRPVFLHTDCFEYRGDIKLSQIPVGREQHAHIFILRRPNFRIGRAK